MANFKRISKPSAAAIALRLAASAGHEAALFPAGQTTAVAANIVIEVYPKGHVTATC